MFVLIFLRVVAEISEVVGDEDVVTAEDLERLQYLEQVFCGCMSKLQSLPVFWCLHYGIFKVLFVWM